MEKLIEKLEKLGADFGPHVLQNLRGVAVIDGWTSIIWGVVFAIMAGVLAKCGLYTFGVAMATEVASYAINWFAVATVVLTAAVAIFSLLAVSALVDPWVYIAIRKPDLYITKKFLDRVSE